MSTENPNNSSWEKEFKAPPPPRSEAAREAHPMSDPEWAQAVESRRQFARKMTGTGIPRDAVNIFGALQEITPELIKSIPNFVQNLQPLIDFQEYVRQAHRGDPEFILELLDNSDAKTVMALNAAIDDFNNKLPALIRSADPVKMAVDMELPSDISRRINSHYQKMAEIAGIGEKIPQTN